MISNSSHSDLIASYKFYFTRTSWLTFRIPNRFYFLQCFQYYKNRIYIRRSALAWLFCKFLRKSSKIALTGTVRFTSVVISQNSRKILNDFCIAIKKRFLYGQNSQVFNLKKKLFLFQNLQLKMNLTPSIISGLITRTMGNFKISLRKFLMIIHNQTDH